MMKKYLPYNRYRRMSFFPIIYSTLGAYTILNSELLTRVIGIALNSLTNSITLMAAATLSNSNSKLKEYMDELEILDIEIKLKLVENWLKEINVKSIKQDTSLDIIYRGVSESCHTISWLIGEINRKIIAYNNLWFKHWRTIDLNLELYKLKRTTKILTDRLNLIAIGCMWDNMNEYRNKTTQEIEDTTKVNYNEVPNYYSIPGEYNKEIEVVTALAQHLQ